MIIEEKTIDMLTKDSVSIKTLKFIEEEGQKYQVGGIMRRAYSNSITGREDITKNEPEDVFTSVLQYWGDEPTVEEPTVEDINCEVVEDDTSGDILANNEEGTE